MAEYKSISTHIYYWPTRRSETIHTQAFRSSDQEWVSELLGHGGNITRTCESFNRSSLVEFTKRSLNLFPFSTFNSIAKVTAYIAPRVRLQHTYRQVYERSIGHTLYENIDQILPNKLMDECVLYFCKKTVLRVTCYQNIYAEKHGRNVHVHTFIGDSHSE